MCQKLGWNPGTCANSIFLVAKKVLVSAEEMFPMLEDLPYIWNNNIYSILACLCHVWIRIASQCAIFEQFKCSQGKGGVEGEGCFILININLNIYFISWILKKYFQIFLKVPEIWIGQIWHNTLIRHADIALIRFGRIAAIFFFVSITRLVADFNSCPFTQIQKSVVLINVKSVLSR